MNLHCIMHFYNEALLMPAWLNHHYDLFDSLTFIDYDSTDSSLEEINSWNFDRKLSIRKSRNREFSAEQCDQEVMEIEKELPPGDFKICLNTTEFIWDSNFRDNLQKAHENNPHINAFGLKSFCLVDNEDRLNSPLDFNNLEIWKDHTWGLLDKNFGTNVPRHTRFVHNAPDGRYGTGRHHVELPRMDLEGSYLLHTTFAPWSQAKQRKLQIQERMPERDKAVGFGVQHMQTPESLEVTYQNWLAQSHDLMENEDYARIYIDYLMALEED